MSDPSPAFTADVVTFSRALRRCAWIIDRKPANELFERVRVEARDDGLKITATNEVTQVTITIPGKGNGVMLIPAKKCADAFRGKAGEVRFSQSEDRIKGECAGLLFRAAIADPKGFPVLPAPFGKKGKAGFRCELERLGWALQACLTSVADDEEAREYLRGVHLGWDTYAQHKGIRLVSTDGRTLTRCQLPEAQALENLEPAKVDCILPRAAVRLLERLMLESEEESPTFVRQGASVVSIEAEDWSVVTGFQPGQFPDHHGVLPAGKLVKTRITLKRDRLAAAVDLVSAVGTTPGQPMLVTFRVENGKLVAATSRDGNTATDAMEATITGPAVTFALNARQLMDVAWAMDDEVTLALIDGETPIRVENPSERDFLGLVMPMKPDAAAAKAKPAAAPKKEPTKVKSAPKPKREDTFVPM